MTALMIGTKASDCRTNEVCPKVGITRSACEGRINIGLFFDGTNNNFFRDKFKQGHSNVARLFVAYKDDPTSSYYPIYIPEVGTEFPAIGESGESMTGNGLGWG